MLLERLADLEATQKRSPSNSISPSTPAPKVGTPAASVTSPASRMPTTTPAAVASALPTPVASPVPSSSKANTAADAVAPAGDSKGKKPAIDLTRFLGQPPSPSNADRLMRRVTARPKPAPSVKRRSVSARQSSAEAMDVDEEDVDSEQDLAPTAAPVRSPTTRRAVVDTPRRRVSSRRHEEPRYPDDEGFDEYMEQLPDLPPNMSLTNLPRAPRRRNSRYPDDNPDDSDEDSDDERLVRSAAKLCAIQNCRKAVHDDRAKYCGDEHRMWVHSHGRSPEMSNES